MPEAPHKQNTCAVVVSYNAGDGFADRVAAAAAIVGGVVVVDNGSTGGAPDSPATATLANAENLVAMLPNMARQGFPTRER